MRYAAKVDTLHADIRDGLRKCGVYVMDLSKAGRGCPDLLCFTRHTGWVPLEVKTRHTKRLQGLTKAQVSTHAQAPIAIVETLDQGLAIFGLERTPT